MYPGNGQKASGLVSMCVTELIFFESFKFKGETTNKIQVRPVPLASVAFFLWFGSNPQNIARVNRALFCGRSFFIAVRLIHGK
jgi:hypothetical protein